MLRSETFSFLIYWFALSLFIVFSFIRKMNTKLKWVCVLSEFIKNEPKLVARTDEEWNGSVSQNHFANFSCFIVYIIASKVITRTKITFNIDDNWRLRNHQSCQYCLSFLILRCASIYLSDSCHIGTSTMVIHCRIDFCALVQNVQSKGISQFIWFAVNGEKLKSIRGESFKSIEREKFFHRFSTFQFSLITICLHCLCVSAFRSLWFSLFHRSAALSSLRSRRITPRRVKWKKVN